MLSDACFDFLSAFGETAQELAKKVEAYSMPPFSKFYGDEIGALRRASAKVQAKPHEVNAKLDLLRLASSVMRFHDTFPETKLSATRNADMLALIKQLREQDERDEQDDQNGDAVKAP